MKKHVNEEVTEFLKFLQNSAKKCAQDYNMLSDDARHFTEVKKSHIYVVSELISSSYIPKYLLIWPPVYETQNCLENKCTFTY